MRRFTISLFVITIANISFLFAQAPFELTLDLFAQGLSAPVEIANAGDDRLFVLERVGTIIILTAQGEKIQTPFLDINDRVHNTAGQSEQGLLGIAFHPDYQTNGYFYVHYSANNDDSVISRFSVNATDPNLADPNSEKEILRIIQPYTNHNGGTLKFGPDGYLFIGMGDGGSANDPQNLAQNTQTLLGKMLRIDIDNGDPYAIPDDNPFVNDGDVLNEIWAIGLRNPWKFSFDREKGDLWIGDVGQGDWEEVNKEEAGSIGGLNYGWRCYEGDHTFITGGCAPQSDYTSPVIEYNHLGITHCSITGGYVYRGNNTDLENFDLYFYSDYCSGALWCSVGDDLSVEQVEIERLNNFSASTFGEDASGEIYIANIRDGKIYHLNLGCNFDFKIAENGFLSAPDGFTSYQWFLNGEEISGATSMVFQPSMTGTYTVEVENVSCTFLSDPLVVDFLSSGSISGLDKIELNPNPVIDYLNLKLQTSSKLDGQITITNLNGQIVFENDIKILGDKEIRINTENLDAAIYILTISSNQEKQSVRFLKL